jgi:hypothetical protein
MLGASKGNSKFSGNKVTPQPAIQKTDKGNGGDFYVPPSKKDDQPDPSCTAEFNEMIGSNFISDYLTGRYILKLAESSAFQGHLIIIRGDVLRFDKDSALGKAQSKQSFQARIDRARVTLNQFKSRCYDSLSPANKKSIENIEAWLNEQENTLNKFSSSSSNAGFAKQSTIHSDPRNSKQIRSNRSTLTKPSPALSKKPMNRGVMGSVSDAMLNYAHYSVNFPNNEIRRFNNFISPKQIKPPPAQLKSQILQEQRDEINRRKKEAADIEAQKNPVANFIYAIPRLLPLLRYVVP